MEQSKLGPYLHIKATQDNCLKVSDLNGIDRAGKHGEIDVGCSIYLMVLMVSDFGVSRAGSCMSVKGGGDISVKTSYHSVRFSV
jgi:hypothetical protein